MTPTPLDAARVKALLSSLISDAIDFPSDHIRLDIGDAIKLRDLLADRAHLLQVQDGQGGWKPIETAPKDGSWFVAYSRFSRNGCRVHWGQNYGKTRWGLKSTDYFWEEGHHNFTDWMPVPGDIETPTQSLPQDGVRNAALEAWKPRSEIAPLDQLIWMTDGKDIWLLKGTGKPLDRRATACKWWCIAAFPQLPNGEAPETIENYETNELKHTPVSSNAEVEEGSGLFFELAEALANLLSASERHIFGDECKPERDYAHAVLAKFRLETNKASSSPSVPPLREEGEET